MNPQHPNKAAPKQRIVLCMGRYCNAGGQAEPLERLLTERLGARVPIYRAKGRIVWEIANCLSMCGAGPNAVVYPADVCYHRLTVDTLQALLDSLHSDPSSTD